jgi:hypothetical protein
VTPDPFAPTAAAPPADRFDRVPAAHESTHAPGPEELWSESWYLDFADPAAGVAGYVRLGLYPNLDVAWYWACLVGEDRPLVIVIDHDIRPPRQGLEIRTEGLWCDYTVETALDHVSVGVEAFAVETDDPTDVYGDLRGNRVPFGLDLEWETAGAVYAYPGVTRYEVPCRVHGEVLLAGETLAIDTFGQRDHSWGVRDWWSYSWSWMAGWLDDGTRFHGTSVDLHGTELYGTGYLQVPDGPGGFRRDGIDVVGHQEPLAASGLPGPGRWQVGELDLAVEPVAFAPVGLGAPDGRFSRFPRAWCRFTATDGRTGHGWVEWNQPVDQPVT